MYKKGYGIYQEAHAQELDQDQLILMMYAGAVNFLNKALLAAKSDVIEMGINIAKAKKVILELMSSLDIEEGGEMGEILFRMYRRLFNKLNAAHMGDDTEKIAEVRDSLVELEDTWKQVFASEEYGKFKENRAVLKQGIM